MGLICSKFTDCVQSYVNKSAGTLLISVELLIRLFYKIGPTDVHVRLNTP